LTAHSIECVYIRFCKSVFHEGCQDDFASFPVPACPRVWWSRRAGAGAGQDAVHPAFEAAQKAGKSIFIDVSAPWCPTCRTQAPIISKLRKEAKYSKVVVFNVDFDSQKDVLKTLNVRSQSTLIGFKGAKEMKRSAGVTDPMAIEDIFEATL